MTNVTYDITFQQALLKTNQFIRMLLMRIKQVTMANLRFRLVDDKNM